MGLLQMSLEETESKWKDRISLLPDSLLCHILSFLTTKEAVCTSVLSSRWRGLWKWVPSLDLVSSDFPSDKVCVDFINEFLLNFKTLSEFKLCIIEQDDSDKDASLYEPCLDKVTKHRIQHIEVVCYKDTEIPLTLPVCEALVSLKLYSVKLNDFESLSLPCLKVMCLEHVIFPHNAVLDTPRLEHLTLTGCQSESFMIIKRMSEHVKVDIEVVFEPKDYDFSERNIIYYLINNFSAVKDMTLSWYTLGLIYCLQGMNPLPKFRNLTRLRATTWLEYSFELLPFVLESCPNLRHLTLKLVKGNNLEAVVNSFSKVLSFCLVSSLEYVDIESPITEKAREEEVVRYFLGNATSLKKLVLRLNVSDGEKHDLEVLKQRFDSPRRSSLCQFDVFLVVLTPDKMKEL
ncbi:hypothetical protein HID58_033813 [Brassica napus]|uniref:FBD domain-containing protein n=1 Tax=Brassica napus TaxID=3708 RepID=A0ABQ8C1A2_BRANA|nr:hypothetical protein HID58_033813 [Brassica napus]